MKASILGVLGAQVFRFSGAMVPGFRFSGSSGSGA